MDMMFHYLISRQKDNFFESYQHVLLQLPSYHPQCTYGRDLKDENSYQAQPAVRLMMLGMCAWLRNDYDIESNREAGKER